jgi:hypothetical protein
VKLTPPVTFAAELFPTTIATPSGTSTISTNGGFLTASDDSFIVMFRPGISAALASSARSIIIKATLSTGTWGADIVPSQLTLCGSSGLALPVVAVDSCGLDNTDAPVLVAKGSLQSKTTDSVADFIVQSQVTTSPFFTTSDWFFFQFDVDDLTSFGGNGSLSLTMEALAAIPGVANQSVGTSTLEIARSTEGLSVKITPNTDPQTIAVDVAQDYKQFIKGSTNTTTVSLGDLTIDINSTNPVKQDGSNEFEISDFSSKSATLTVTNGIFSASKGANAVFLDLNGDDIFGTGDIAGVVSSDNVATWNLTSSNIETLRDNDARFMVVADGTTSIATLSDPPTAILDMTYTSGGTKKTYKGKLRHIKDNGTKCTLYNIPDGTAGRGSLDGVSVRFTNKSTTRTGTIFGDLIDEKGVSIYGARKTLATVEPSATVRLNSGEGGDLDLTFGQYNWAGQRAKLVITSDLQDVEIFGLVRNVQGGPSMNVSTGATGNGCVE